MSNPTAPVLAATPPPAASAGVLTEIANATSQLKSDVAADTGALGQIAQNLGLAPAPPPVAKNDNGPVLIVAGLLVLVGAIGLVLYVVRRGRR